MTRSRVYLWAAPLLLVSVLLIAMAFPPMQRWGSRCMDAEAQGVNLFCQ